MPTLAIILGIYSYLIFFLGLLGLLYVPVIIAVTALLFFSLLFLAKNILYIDRSIVKNPLIILLTCVLFLQAGVNFIGTLGPELGFDALWYHLTLPKLYLAMHRIYYIPYGVFYYSAMPKLIEMYYVASLALGQEIMAKGVHFLFGILTCIVIYKLSRKFLSPLFSFLAVVIFYSNLVVGWESITAYIDLGRAFFEITALYSFFLWLESGKKKYFYLSAIIVGLAITAKFLAAGSLLIFIVLIYIATKKQKVNIINRYTSILVYLLISVVIPLPWFIFSFIHTGNPFYPFFSSAYPSSFSILQFNPIAIVATIWNVFTHSQDPISPIYIAFLPLVLFVFKKFSFQEKLLALYSLLAIIVWYFSPQTGGGRFLLPYLPALSVVAVLPLIYIKKPLRLALFTYILLISLISIGYRFVANARYIPVIIGRQSKTEFLTKNLNFSYGDFYDIDGFFAKTIKPTDKVLLLGFHNMYYVNFPFTFSDTDNFNYIATQNAPLPDKFTSWAKIYENDITHVSLYKKIVWFSTSPGERLSLVTLAK